MKSKLVVRSLAVATCVVLAATAAGSANGSGYPHPTTVSTVAATWTPHLVETGSTPHPAAYAIDEAGSQMVVGGNFDEVENSNRTVQYPRSNVFAFNATTGAISTGFAPLVNGDVWSVLSDGTSVWIGGGFTTVNGVTRRAIAKLNLATGQLDPLFTPALSGRVSDMAMHNGRLIVAGTFRAASWRSTPAPATCRHTSRTWWGGGCPTATRPRCSSSTSAPTGNASSPSATSSLSTGWPVRGCSCSTSATTSTLSTWNYEPNGVSCSSTRVNAQAYIQDVDFAPDSSWFAVAAFGFRYRRLQGPTALRLGSRFETTTSTRHADLDQLHRRRLAEVCRRDR